MASRERTVHRLINAARKRRGIPPVRWSWEMARFAKSQARYCAKVGKLVHSNKPALKGGENLCGGKGNLSPRGIVRCWMTSSAGHREWLLDPRVKTAGVGIARSKHGTYAAWAFSDQSLFQPFKIKIPKINIPFFIGKRHRIKGGRGVLRLPVKIFLIIFALALIVLGAHGIWVYFSPVEFLFGAPGAKLFLSFEIPGKLRPMVEWMSMKGLQSWFVPALSIFIGLVIWGWQSNIDVGNRLGWLKKLHLW